ncbi:MAG: squalene/phytoene synthase family protein [Nitrospinae bacterium]|nr:squalene/phytoene synthase family protein [Nitrospinota bacterium]
MDDWDYCVRVLPKVSRTFALNISVLKGELHRGILTAYLFCRIIDTVEDAAKLDPRTKIKLLTEFSRLVRDADYRARELTRWIQDCAMVDGSANDLDLLANTARAFRIFDTLPESHRNQIVPSVSEMARGMAYFQKKFDRGKPALLESENELEEYCYYVAGAVGEMLCNLFLVELPGLPESSREVMKRNAVSFGLGLQMTNISKDVIVDRKRGWSYIPRSLITANGLTVEEFNSAVSAEENLRVLEKLLQKTAGHLQDALKFTLAIPRGEYSIRLFCIWPLWMALETVAVLHNNRSLIDSDDPVKISREAVKSILRRTSLICFSNFLLKRSFDRVLKRSQLEPPPRFDLDGLKLRLSGIPLDNYPLSA